MKVLYCWVGTADLNAARDSKEGENGPIGQALLYGDFDHAVLLFDVEHAPQAVAVKSFLKKLVSDKAVEIRVVKTNLTNPTDFEQIYDAAASELDNLLGENPESITLHLSPGTPAMLAVWVLLSARSPDKISLIQTRRGSKDLIPANIPFDIHAEYVPALVQSRSRQLQDSLTPAVFEDFGSIVYRSRVMVDIVEKARKVAAYDISVLILGESGTGKEGFARQIHENSLRADKPFLPVNCGTLNSELLTSELFGHEKGAFTGADTKRKGVFEDANTGTVFLDEVGEMDLEAQKQLLRVLQERKIRPTGSNREKDVDVRVIAATNKNLIKEVREGRFREDLYYRLAEIKLTLPPLRNRQGDLPLLTDHLLKQKCDLLGAKLKEIAPSARRALGRHHWPGNVRELEGVLSSALIWSEGSKITAKDIENALDEVDVQASGDILERELGKGFNIKGYCDEIKLRYVKQALTETNHHQSKAAELLGMDQRTLSAYMKQQDLRK